jgi:hypothetical protein
MAFDVRIVRDRRPSWFVPLCSGAARVGAKPQRQRTPFSRTRGSLVTWFRAMWYVTSQKNGASALGLQRVLGLGSYETAWTWLHKSRRAMVRPDRDRLKGWVEVDETMVGGLEEGVAGQANRK